MIERLQNIIKRIYELCNEPADNMAVVEFQERIKAIINEQA